MNPVKRRDKRNQLQKNKRKAYGLYKKYTRDDDIARCQCKKHGDKT